MSPVGRRELGPGPRSVTAPAVAPGVIGMQSRDLESTRPNAD